MTLTQQLITIAMIVLGTAITRYLPFLLFPSGRQTPKYVRYLGKVRLPRYRPVGHLLSAQCQRAQRTIWHPGITVYRPGRLFALWKRQMLLSIAGGTIFYMILVQTLF